MGKFGQQAKDEGILCLDRVHLTNQAQNGLMAYVRGKSNVVQVFNATSSNEVISSVDYS